ncbi:MAG: hypothetical protein ACM3KR_06455 [Deltaproteobacteria bacterium]
MSISESIIKGSHGFSVDGILTGFYQDYFLLSEKSKITGYSIQNGCFFVYFEYPGKCQLEIDSIPQKAYLLDAEVFINLLECQATAGKQKFLDTCMTKQ